MVSLQIPSCFIADFTPPGFPSTKHKDVNSVRLWCKGCASMNLPSRHIRTMVENIPGSALPITDITPTAPIAIKGNVIGSSPEMNKIMQIAKKYKIHIIEDACMGIGAKIDGKSPGTFGIVNAFSMHPLKSLNVMGDGGMAVTNKKEIYNT